MIDNLLLGAQTIFAVNSLLYAFFGVLIGNIVGVLPGIGALAAISLLLPVTYGMDPIGAIVMLAGIYYGTSFGGATTAILLNIPGTPVHAVICVDGHPLAKQGKGEVAILGAMLASAFGVLVAVLVMTYLSPVIAEAAFNFGPADYFGIMILGLIAAGTMSSGSFLLGLSAVLVGLFLGVVGTDNISGVWRFTLGFDNLAEGVPLVPLALALFGVSDVLRTAGKVEPDNKGKAESFLSSKKEKATHWRCVGKEWGSMIRGSALGSFFGALPGTGGTIASFISYAVEKKINREKEKFGNGALGGVTGPEAANSAADVTAFIPTLTLGIPGDAVMALMLGALMIHDITPGPFVLSSHPELFWGLIVSFMVGNIMLLILNIPLVRLWVKLLKLPYRFIFPVILFLIAIAAFSEHNSSFDIGVAMAIGCFGYLCCELKIPPAPLLLGFVLGPLLEENFRRALILSDGRMLSLLERPVSATFLIGSGLIIVWAVWRKLGTKRV